MPASDNLQWAVLGRAGEREILIPTKTLREVTTLGKIHPLPAEVPSLMGVMIHQGELLPLLRWAYWETECTGPQVAILRCRLGVPVDRLERVINLQGQSVEELPEIDPWKNLSIGIINIPRPVPVLDMEKLLAVLQNRSFRH